MLPKVDYACITPLFCILFEKIEWLKLCRYIFAQFFRWDRKKQFSNMLRHIG